MSWLVPQSLSSMYDGLSRGERVEEGYGGFPGLSEHAQAQRVALARWRSGRDGPGATRRAIGAWPRIAALENESIDAITCDWRDPGPFPFNQYLALPVIPEDTQAARARPYQAELRAELERLLAAGGTDATTPDTVVYPVAKGKGAPFWFTGDEAWAAYAIYQLEREHLGASEELSPCSMLLTLYKRIQGTRKESKRWAWTGGGGPMRGGATKQWPKVRKVMGYPLGRNIRLAAFTHSLFNAFRAGAIRIAGNEFKCLRPLADAVTEARLRGPSSGYAFYAEDAKQHDDTVGFAVFRATAATAIAAYASKGPAWALGHPLFNARAVESVLVGDLAMPMSFPPITTDGQPRLLERRQGLASGQNSTAVMTSLVRTLSFASRLAFLGITGVVTYITGDDTFAMFRNRADLDKYTEEFGDPVKSAEFDGYTTEPEDDWTFLKHNALLGCMYGAQALLNTLNREDGHEPRTPGLTVVAAAARLGGLEQYPDRDFVVSILTDPACVGHVWAAAYRAALHVSAHQLAIIARASVEDELRSGVARATRTVESIIQALNGVGPTALSRLDVPTLTRALTEVVPERSWVPISQFEEAARTMDRAVTQRNLSRRGGTMRTVALTPITPEEAELYAHPQ